MNDYPVWWDQTVTVYNKYTDPTTHRNSWQSTIVTGCFWKDREEITISKAIIIPSNIMICRIPLDDRFVERYVWEEMPEETRAKFFTLSPGDILVRGAVVEPIDEYSSGSRLTDFVAKQKRLRGCMQIEQSTINVGTGRVLEHYLLKGK